MKKKILVGVVLVAVIAAAGAGGFYYYMEQQLFGRVEGQYFDSDGVRIHYTDEGQGDPVILIHGFSVNADIQWRRPGVTQALSKEFRVIALDNRGHGLSDKPHDPAQYGTALCEDVIRLMDHLGIEKAAVAGYSMGGMITMKLIATHPERLVCAAPCAYGWAEQRPEDGEGLGRLVASLKAGEGFGPLFEILTPLSQDKPDPKTSARMNGFLTALNDQQALAAAVESWPALLVDEASLRANEVPVLAIVGADDPLKRDVDRMVGVMNHLDVVYIDGRNHMNAITDEFIDRLKGFIEDSYGAAKDETTALPAAA